MGVWEWVFPTYSHTFSNKMVLQPRGKLAEAEDLERDLHLVGAGGQEAAVDDDGQALAGGEVKGRLRGDGGYLARDGAKDQIDQIGRAHV